MPQTRCPREQDTTGAPSRPSNEVLLRAPSEPGDQKCELLAVGMGAELNATTPESGNL